MPRLRRSSFSCFPLELCVVLDKLEKYVAYVNVYLAEISDKDRGRRQLSPESMVQGTQWFLFGLKL